MRLLRPTGCGSGSLYTVLYAGHHSSPSNYCSIDTTDLLVADFRSVSTDMDEAVLAGEEAENKRRGSRANASLTNRYIELIGNNVNWSCAADHDRVLPRTPSHRSVSCNGMGMFVSGPCILEEAYSIIGHRGCHYRSGASENCLDVPTASVLGSSDCTVGRLVSYTAHLC
jgi:hypothetical protein